MGLFKKKEREKVSFDSLLKRNDNEREVMSSQTTNLSDEDYLKEKFKEIDRNNETFELTQKAGKLTEGVLWDNDDFNPNEVYGRKHGTGGNMMPLYDRGVDPAHKVDEEWYRWDMHDEKLDMDQFHDR